MKQFFPVSPKRPLPDFTNDNTAVSYKKQKWLTLYEHLGLPPFCLVWSV